MNIKEWVKGVSDEELRRAVVSIQVELISRSISAAHDKIEAPEVKPAGGYDVFLPPPAADIKISIAKDDLGKLMSGIPVLYQRQPTTEEVLGISRSGMSIASLSELVPAHAEVCPDNFPTITQAQDAEDDAGNVCYPYLLANVEIPSCPVIGKEQLKGDPLDFEGMEI